MQDPRRWRAAAWRAGGALAGLARWTLAAVLIGLLCGAVGSAFHLAVDTVTEWRAAYPQLIAALPVMGLAIVALYKAWRAGMFLGRILPIMKFRERNRQREG